MAITSQTPPKAAAQIFVSDGAGDDSRKPIPATVSGHVVHKSEAQIFCKTETVLTYGMCGGPVVVSEDDQGGGLLVAKLPV